MSDVHGQVLVLLLRPDGMMDDGYSEGDPGQGLPHNVPFVLLHHLNHPRQASSLMSIAICKGSIVGSPSL